MAHVASNVDTVTDRRPIVIRRYAGQRLYDTGGACYVSLEDLSQMVKDKIEFVVEEAENGADITRTVLTQIIVNLIH